MNKNGNLIDKKVSDYIEKYANNFNDKRNELEAVKNEHDLLMDIFDITPEEKKNNAQYWGRELGMLWQNIIKTIFENSERIKDYKGPITITDSEGHSDEPCDLSANGYAIDTKYRIGSGDSRFSKQFKLNYDILKNEYQLTPVLLILRKDNLITPIRRAQKEGWTVFCGEESYAFVEQETGYDLKTFLKKYKDRN